MSRPSPKKKPGKLDSSPSSAPAKGERNLIFKVLLILLSGLFVYAPVFHGGWLWDDDQEITANAILPDPQGLAKIWIDVNAMEKTPASLGDTPFPGKAALERLLSFLPAQGADYFPLKTTVQWLLYRVFQTNQTGWHLTNIALHLVNAFLIWALFRRLGIREAWIGGLLFAIHPILVESVAWVSELKNTLSLPFLILAMLAYINFEERGSRRDLIFAVLAYLASILCKTSVVMFPFVILLYGWWRSVGNRTPADRLVPVESSNPFFAWLLAWVNAVPRRTVLASIPFFLISLILGLITIHFQHGRAIGTETIPVGGLLSRTATAGMAVFFYLYKTVLPFHLLPIYSRWEVDPPQLWQLLTWPAFAAMLCYFWTKRATWGRHVLLGVGFFFLTVFPTLGFVTMSYMRITWVADHFVYLPAIGIIGLMTVAVDKIYDAERPRKFFLGVGVFIFAVFVFESHRYAGIFFNEERMWTYTLKSNPDAWQAHSRLGKVMIETNRYDQAFFHISESVRLRPDLAETHNNYGAMLEKKGDLEGALAQLREANRIAPDIIIYKINLGSLLVRMGRHAEGRELYEELLKIEPGNPTFMCNLGVALYFLNRNDEAIVQFQNALKIKPDLKDAKENLAAALKKRDGNSTGPAPAPLAPSGTDILGGTSSIKLFGN